MHVSAVAGSPIAGRRQEFAAPCLETQNAPFTRHTLRYLQIAAARKPRIASPKGGRIMYSASTILLW